MTKKLFLSTLFLCLGMIAKAEDTDVSQYENIVFPVSTTGEAGTTVTVSVEMNNTIQVAGFQFDIYLPNGITIPTVQTDDGDKYLIELSGTRSKSSHSIEGGLQDDGSIRVLCTSFPTSTFSGTSGEVCTIELSIGEDVTDGDYPIIFKNVIISDAQSQKIKVEQVEATLTVGVVNVNYDEGYLVDFLPFAVNEEEGEVPLLLDNLTAITNIAFDLEMPEVLVDLNEDIYYYYINNLLGRNFNVLDEPDEGGIVHVSIDRRSRNKIAAGEDTEIVTFGILNEEGTLPEGVYSIKIKNIQMTDESGETYIVAPYTTEIFVGENPKIEVSDGVAAFHGNYGGADEFALLKAALPEGATIDLTEVSAMAEDLTELRTDNVFVTAETVSYGRSMTTVWGTLCLPFAVESTDGFQLFKLTEVGESALTFNTVDSAEPNTPLVFKVSGNGFTVKASNDTSIPASVAETQTFTADAIEDWTWNGSYINETLDVSSMQAYALMDDEFHRITKTLAVKAFRAWLQNNGAPRNAALRISDDTNGIEFVEQEDGSVKLLFDLQGRQLKDGARSQMFIENGQKKFNRE